MGCDIHCYIEYSDRKPPRSGEPRYWLGFGGRINPGRDYTFFATIAGVRNYDEEIKPMYPLRGLPDDMSYAASGDSRLYICDEKSEGYIDKATAEKWVEQGMSKIIDGKWVTHPDWHSHTCLTGKEWREACAKLYNDEDVHWNVEYWAMCAAMTELENRGFDTRVVIWFDN